MPVAGVDSVTQICQRWHFCHFLRLSLMLVPKRLLGSSHHICICIHDRRKREDDASYFSLGCPKIKAQNKDLCTPSLFGKWFLEAEEEEQRVREGRKKRQEDLLRSLLPWVMGAQFPLDLQRGVRNASQKCTPERQGYLSTPEGGWSISPPGPVPHWLRVDSKSMNPTPPGFTCVQGQWAYIASEKPQSREQEGAQCTLEVRCCLREVSPKDTKPSTAAAAEIRGELRACDMGHHSHPPPQQTSLCLVSQNCITWPLTAEREAARQTS